MSIYNAEGKKKRNYMTIMDGYLITQRAVHKNNI